MSNGNVQDKIRPFVDPNATPTPTGGISAIKEFDPLFERTIQAIMSGKGGGGGPASGGDAAKKIAEKVAKKLGKKGLRKLLDKLGSGDRMPSSGEGNSTPSKERMDEEELQRNPKVVVDDGTGGGGGGGTPPGLPGPGDYTWDGGDKGFKNTPTTMLGAQTFVDKDGNLRYSHNETLVYPNGGYHGDASYGGPQGPGGSPELTGQTPGAFYFPTPAIITTGT